MSSNLVIKILNSYRKCKSTELWLAVVMGAMAQEDGTQICDKIATLAKRLGVSHRTIQYRLRRMESDVFVLKTNAGDGRNGQPTRYRIAPQWIASTPSVDSIFERIANAPHSGIADSGAGVGARSRKRVGARSANCLKNERNSLHPLYTDFSLYKLNDEGYKTLGPARRLAPDWRLPNRFGQWALEAFPGWSRELILHFAEKFRGYWTRTGCAKSDWFDTWCRFCQQEADYLVRNPQGQALVAASPVAAPATSCPVLPYPGESEESYRRRKQVAADKPDAPPVAAMATQARQPEQATSRTPESKARIKAELMRALQAAKQGETCLAERLGTTASPAQTRRVSEWPAAADSQAIDKGAAVNAPQPRAEKPVEASPDTVVCDSNATADALSVAPSKSTPLSRIMPRARPSGASSTKRSYKPPPAPAKRRATAMHARASPHKPRVPPGHQCQLKTHTVSRPWRAQPVSPSVRLHYLLPDATGQWR